jgi:hypothetical protein
MALFRLSEADNRSERNERQRLAGGKRTVNGVEVQQASKRAGWKIFLKIE